MGSCPFVCHQDGCYITALKLNKTNVWNSTKTFVAVCTTTYDQDKGDVESEKWDTVDDESNRVHRLDNCWRRTVTIARAVAPFRKERILRICFAILIEYYSTNMSPVNKYTLPKRATGSKRCAHTNNNTTQTVIRMNWPFKTNLNRFSCSIWVNSIGWRKARMRERSNHCLPLINSRNILVTLRLMKEQVPNKAAQPHQTELQGC